MLWQVKREREEGASELQDSERKYLDKMSGLRGRHEADLQLLQTEHARKVQSLAAPSLVVCLFICLFAETCCLPACCVSL
jgi:hypothetical protein